MNIKVLLAACATALAGLLATPAALAQSDSAQACAACHQAAFESFSKTKHGVRGDAKTPAGMGKDCLSCHVDAAAHAKDPSKKPVAFAKTSPIEARNAGCVSCHKGAELMHWKGSAHERSDVACVDCHKSHSPKDQVLVPQTQAGVCYDCHKNVRSDTMKISAHPVKTGQMACSSCHNPHGSVAKAQMKGMTVNETCFTCHADKRGPFLVEHPPAADDCTSCHKPHGSNISPMLKARAPFSCQSCHAGSHAKFPMDASNTPQPDYAKASAQRNCTACHAKVHGSNSPNGRALFR